MKAKRSPWKRLATIFVMIAPALLIAVGIVIYPIINTVIKSFRDSKTGAFTLANYEQLFTDSFYAPSIWYTIWVTVVTVLLAILISYLLALYLRFSDSKISHFISTIYLLPRFVPVLVAVSALKMIIGDTGLLNRLMLKLFGWDYKPGLLYNAKGIILANLWFNIPFATMILSAALSGVSSSIVESAQDVGAGKLLILFKMILPLTVGDIMIAAVFIFMSNISSFTTPYLIGARFPTMLGVTLNSEFGGHHYEFAAAISVVIFLLSLVSAIVYIHTNLKEREWEKN